MSHPGRPLLQCLACSGREARVRRMSYRIDPRLPLTHEIRRIATEKLESALGHLATAGTDPDKALHDCRKRLKSVRALIRLVRSGDPKFARAQNARCQKASARLAAPREAAALVETLDRLAEEYPGEAAGGTLDPIRNELLARHAAAGPGPAQSGRRRCGSLPDRAQRVRWPGPARPARGRSGHSRSRRPQDHAAAAQSLPAREGAGDRAISTICASRSKPIPGISPC